VEDTSASVAGDKAEAVGDNAATLPRVRLIRKFARLLNGVDLSGVGVGQILWVSEREAAMLIAERWAVAEPASTANDGSRKALNLRVVRREEKGAPDLFDLFVDLPWPRYRKRAMTEQVGQIRRVTDAARERLNVGIAGRPGRATSIRALWVRDRMKRR
jgi:hypothetical protein